MWCHVYNDRIANYITHRVTNCISYVYRDMPDANADTDSDLSSRG